VEGSGSAIALSGSNTLEVFYWSIEIRVNAPAVLRQSQQKFCGCYGGFPCRRHGKTRRIASLKPSTGAEEMTDLLNVAMLIAASVGSMALGVLGAYAIFRVGFAWLRQQPRTPAVKTQPEAARVS